MTNATLHTERLATLIAAKLQVLEILAPIARRQAELIAAAEMTSLTKLLAAKQTVMSQLQAVEQQLVPFRGDDPEARVWKSPVERVACQAQAERCNALLAETLELERHAETEMTRRRDAAAAALAGLHSASDARRAYVPTVAPLSGSLQVEG